MMFRMREILVTLVLFVLVSSFTTLADFKPPLLDLSNESIISEESPIIVLDYSHGQSSVFVEVIDLELQSSLESLGYTVVWAKGGLNASILEDAKGLILGSIYGASNGFLPAEVSAISDWFDEGLKFLWVASDSDYVSSNSGQFINDNMSLILESVGSHVYPEPTSIMDPFSNADASYRPIANVTTDYTPLSAAVENVSSVLMHSPTLLYGSNSTSSPGVNVYPINLEDNTIPHVYPLLWYSETATITDSDLIVPYAHSDGSEGSFVAVTLETHLGADDNNFVVVSGASPYGYYRPMYSNEFYGYPLDGDHFVLQMIDFGMSIGQPKVNSPDDILYEEGLSGYSIEWNLEGLFPKLYNITKDGLLIREGTWNSSSEIILVDVDGLTPELYNYTLTLTSMFNLTTVDSVLVDVEPAQSPTINSPENIIYTVGDSGNEIQWVPSDLSLHSYEIIIDGVLTASHNWIDEEDTTVTVDVDGLAVGVYNYTIVVYDALSLDVVDTVMVEVIEAPEPTTTPSTTTPTTPTSPAGEGELPDLVIVTIAGGSILVILIVIVLIRKNQT